MSVIIVVLLFCFAITSTFASEEDALRDLFESTQGEVRWSISSGWMTEKSYCTWFGISCNDQNQVISLELASNNLIGKIPSSFSELTSLETLILRGNERLQGEASVILQLPNLKILDIGRTQIAGWPRDFACAQTLEYLNLDHFYMHRQWNSQLLFPKLEYLNLRHTSVRTFPNFTAMPKLRTLVLSTSSMTDTEIPDSFYNLQFLEEVEFQIENRDWDGRFAISPAIENLRNLKKLDLDMTLATLPDSFGNLRSLTNLAIKTRSLSYMNPIIRLPNLRSLDLEVYRITIPESFGDLVSLNRLRIRSYESPIIVPSTIGNLSQLKKLVLGSSNIRLHESIGRLANLTELVVSTIEGTVPSYFGSLEKLEVLDIYTRNLKTGLPRTIGQLKNLKKLDVGGSMPGPLPDVIEQCTSLQIISMYSLELVGTIPDSWRNLVNLKTLDLHSNGLNGTIPDIFGNMEQLQDLDLSSNEFTGNLPKSLQNNTFWCNLGYNPLTCPSDPLSHCVVPCPEPPVPTVPVAARPLPDDSPYSAPEPEISPSSSSAPSQSPVQPPSSEAPTAELSPSSSSKSDSDRTWIIIGAVAAGVIVIAGIVTLLVIRSKRRRDYVLINDQQQPRA